MIWYVSLTSVLFRLLFPLRAGAGAVQALYFAGALLKPSALLSLSAYCLNNRKFPWPEISGDPSLEVQDFRVAFAPILRFYSSIRQHFHVLYCLGGQFFRSWMNYSPLDRVVAGLCPVHDLPATEPAVRGTTSPGSHRSRPKRNLPADSNPLLPTFRANGPAAGLARAEFLLLVIAGFPHNPNAHVFGFSFVCPVFGDPR